MCLQHILYKYIGNLCFYLKNPLGLWILYLQGRSLNKNQSFSDFTIFLMFWKIRLVNFGLLNFKYLIANKYDLMKVVYNQRHHTYTSVPLLCKQVIILYGQRLRFEL